jgi:hypothetical protein
MYVTKNAPWKHDENKKNSNLEIGGSRTRLASTNENPHQSKKTQLKKEAALAASTSEQRESCSKNTTARARNRSTEENIDRCLAKRQKTKLEKRPHRI